MSIFNMFPGNPGLASTTKDGLMSSTDKSKLNGIAYGANNYTHPSTHAADIITQDSTHRFVTDEQITTWTAKASTAIATTSSNGLMSSTDKIKLDGIEEGANNYTHPSDANTRHVTDTQIDTWNSKASTDVATTSTNGLMSSTDKNNLENALINITELLTRVQDIEDKLKTAVFYA